MIISNRVAVLSARRTEAVNFLAALADGSGYRDGMDRKRAATVERRRLCRIERELTELGWI